MITVDGGQTWSTQASGTSLWLRDMAQVGQVELFIAGEEGIILHSVDGGTTWEQQATGTSNMLVSIFFSDNLHGWAAGQEGIILYTQDGGETWMPQESNTSVQLNDIFFTDAHNGWVCGDGGLILHTFDGGATWSGMNITFENLYGICFTDQYNGWVAGVGGTVMHTENAGAVGVKEFKVQSSKFKVDVFPNPTGGIFNLQFTVYSLQSVSCSIFDFHGREVASVLDKKLPAGEHNLKFDLSGLPSGIYLLKATAGTNSTTQKIIIKN